jgi:hypothetical protein
MGLGSDLDVSVVCSTSTEMPIGQMSIGQMTYYPQKSRNTQLVYRVGLGLDLAFTMVCSPSTEMPVGQMSIGQMTYHPQKSINTQLVYRDLGQT